MGDLPKLDIGNKATGQDEGSSNSFQEDGERYHTVLGSMRMSHQRKAGERCKRASKARLAWPVTRTPFS